MGECHMEQLGCDDRRPWTSRTDGQVTAWRVRISCHLLYVICNCGKLICPARIVKTVNREPAIIFF